MVTCVLRGINNKWQKSKFDGYIIKLILEDIDNGEEYICWFSHKHPLADRAMVEMYGENAPLPKLKLGRMYTDLVFSEYKKRSTSNRNSAYDRKIIDPIKSKFTEFTKIRNIQ